MKISLFAFAAVAAAGGAAAQSNVEWKPLNGQQAQQPASAAQAAPIKQAPSAAIAPAAPQASASAPSAAVPQSTTAWESEGRTAPLPTGLASAAAPSAPKSLVLWRNIQDHMSVAQLRALYPQGKDVVYKSDRTVLADVPIIEGCQAKVNVMHPDGFVKEIVMRGEGSIAGRCSLKLITALSGKYGEPLDKDKVGGSLFGRQGKNYIWARDGVTLQFKRYTSGALGGGGLFSASWELRYSTADANIDL